MPRKKIEGTCRLCGKNGKLSFEHVPPESCFNNSRVTMYNFNDLINARFNVDQLEGGLYQQRGMGGYTLCDDCNNKTGSWYMAEYGEWVSRCASILWKALPPPDQFNKIKETILTKCILKNVYPLRFIKAIVAMLFSANGDNFRGANPDLVTFVLEKEKTGLPARYAFGINLFHGDKAKLIGVAVTADMVTGKFWGITEVAYPPLSCIMLLDSPEGKLSTGNITDFSNLAYDRRCTVEIVMQVGFSNSMYPGDLRSSARIRFEAS